MSLYNHLLNIEVIQKLSNKLKPDLPNKTEVREKPAPTATNPIKSKESPSLFECGQNLKNKVRIINLNDKLFFFNGFCYEPADKNDILILYRQTVDVIQATKYLN